MRAVVQRVREAKVTVEETPVGSIGAGLLIFLGVGEEDREADANYLVDKIVNLRIFGDEAGKFNRSLTEIAGEVLVVSQFTLWGDCRKGRRPSFSHAATPELAERLYLHLVSAFQGRGIKTATGRFGAKMEVHLINDGPVTLLLDSRKEF
jgi:D-tyrosyl-tRNA(Tyr) deacylase